MPSGRCLRRLIEVAGDLDMPSIVAVDGFNVKEAPALAGAIGAFHVARQHGSPPNAAVPFDPGAALRDQIAAAAQPAVTVTRLSHAAAAQDMKSCILRALATAGMTELTVRFAHDMARFIASVRRGVYGESQRVMTGSWTMAIGHLAMLAHYVYAMRQGVADYRTLKIWEGPVGNRPLFELIRAGAGDVEVVPPFLSACDNHWSLVPEIIDGGYLDHFSACERILALRPPPNGRLLDPPPNSAIAVRTLLADAGLPPDRPFVTLHVRENHRKATKGSASRNADIALMRPALSALVDKGLSVIRLGDASMTALTGIEGVFDYALSESTSAALDVALAAHGRFHIGTSSGMSLVPMLFGVPTLFLNWYPIQLIPYGARNHVVLKGLRSIATGERASAAEDYRRVGISTDPEILAEDGLRLVDLDALHIGTAVDRFARAVEAGLHAETLHGEPKVFAPADDGSLVEMNRRELKIV